MVISFTTSKLSADQASQVDTFLQGFLSRLVELPGVVAAYHFTNETAGESTTVIVWRDDESRLAYRNSDLIKEAMKFERQMGISSSREAYPLTFPPVNS